MKPGTSSLNPYAEAYVPLSKRPAPDGNIDFQVLTKDVKAGNEAAMDVRRQYQYYRPQSYNTHSIDAPYATEQHRTKGHYTKEFQGSSSYYSNVMIDEQQPLDDDPDMHMAYLQMTYPGISDQSLSDVYLVNKGDLDATVEMLNQLEFSSDSSEKLPDTLDIGDVSESASSSTSMYQKMKEVTDQATAGASSSLGSGSAPRS